MDRGWLTRAGQAAMERLDLPGDIPAGVPHMELIGEREFFMCRHRGVLSYSTETVEIGGGSLRIYDRELQQKMFDLLHLERGEVEARFGHLLNAFRFGAPPHGGLAYGFDRLVMLLAGEESIREVMAFPKQQNASELMTNSPSDVEQKQLDELHIALVDQEN